MSKHMSRPNGKSLDPCSVKVELHLAAVKIIARVIVNIDFPLPRDVLSNLDWSRRELRDLADYCKASVY